MNRWRINIAFTNDTPCKGYYPSKVAALEQAMYWQEQDNTAIVVVTDTRNRRRMLVWIKDEETL